MGECGLFSFWTLKKSGMVWVCCVHACQNGLLVFSGWAKQSREAGIRVLAGQLFLLLAEVESFFWLEDLRGVGLLGLRGGHTRLSSALGVVIVDSHFLGFFHSLISECFYPLRPCRATWCTSTFSVQGAKRGKAIIQGTGGAVRRHLC